MLSKRYKWNIAFIFVLIMAFLLNPVYAVATDTDTETNTPPTDTVSENETLIHFRAQIDDILIQYLGYTDISTNKITSIVEGMDDEAVESAWLEMCQLEDAIIESAGKSKITEKDAENLYSENTAFSHFASLICDRINKSREGISFLAAASGSPQTVLDGAITITVTYEGGTGASISQSSGTLTIKANGGSVIKGQSEATVTITNTGDSSGTLQFHYVGSNYSSFSHTPDEDDITQKLGPTESVTMKIKGKSSMFSNTAQLVLSGFSFEAASGGNITFDFDSTLGKISIGGTEYTTPPTTTFAVDGTAGITLTATPTETGATFVGWRNSATNELWSEEANFSFHPDADITLRAEFAEADDCFFIVGEALGSQYTSYMSGAGIDIKEPVAIVDYYNISGKYLYDTLDEALTAASGFDKAKVVVPTNNFSLSANSTTTIPSGVTLLIPFDEDYTMFTTGALNIDSNTAPTKHRTMTMDTGAKLIINGALSVSGKHQTIRGSADGLGCSPAGPQGFVDMEEGSEITVNAGGSLYAYGYIEGNGTVSAMGPSGSTAGAAVYELFQVTDFRGGNATTKMDGGTASDGTVAGTFPFSQYYVQNIQVPMTIHYGATEYIFTTISMANGFMTTVTPLVATSNAMFTISNASSYVVKDYIEETDSQKYDFYGELAFSSIDITLTNDTLLKVALSAAGLPSKINSANYVFPLTNNMDITQHTGTLHIKQDVELLPGSHVKIAEGATLKLYSGYNMYVYDTDEWGNFSGPANHIIIPLINVPNKEITRTADSLTDAAICVNGTLNASASYIYTTTHGSNIYSTDAGQVITMAGSDTTIYEVEQYVENNEQQVRYHAVSITPAKLKNADGSYVETANDTEATTYYYSKEHGRWDRANNHMDTPTTVAATCLTGGYTVHTCSCGYVYADTFTAVGDHNMVNGVCSVCGYTEGTDLFQIDYVSLSMENSLEMNFAFLQSHIGDTGTYEVRFIRLNPDGTKREAYSVPQSEWKSATISGNKYYYASYTGLAAKEMTDMLYVAVYKDGARVSEVKQDSIQNQAMRNLELTTSSLTQHMVVDMLNYGAAAQQKFSYQLHNLANSQLTEDQQKKWATPSVEYEDKSTVTEGVTYQANVKLESNIQFIIGLGGIENAKTVDIAFADHYGLDKSILNIPWSDFTANGSLYTYTIDKTVIADAWKDITITVKNGDAVVAEITDNIASYAARAKSKTGNELYEMIVKFSYSAKEYLHDKYGIVEG